ncbi:hypothetical protein [Chitinolyticbacter meiyuanensis]|uniref:hypothetical protein n=1 Tax=Chitinolyticbacter meiyuanensis TaxID=682798 RepID=UPI0011E5FEAC|nr:hypothetical protein [Chitinolyticbacter meiyuanensis]
MSTEIIARLKALKLYGMAANWPEVLARSRHAAFEPETLLGQLCWMQSMPSDRCAPLATR